MELTDKTVVAMSGGVDSSVAALLMRQAGHDIVGVSMQVWDYRNQGGSCSRATCCAPDDFNDARRVAGRIGIPYYVFDFEESFREKVINQFVNSYQNALTPNPCVECNNKIKFQELRQRALSFGCRAIATGHYAQIEKREDGCHLLRSADKEKDQSYFLYGLKQAELESTYFPIGKYTKSAVREIAKEADLVTHDKAESQDICFVSGSVSDFLVTLGAKKKAGKIIKKNQEVVGQHEGIHGFTVGQRRGLNIGGQENPLYVLELDPVNNLVVVGEKSELRRESFRVGELNWVAPDLVAGPPAEFTAIVQVRHQHPGVKCQVKLDSPGILSVSFVNDWTPVTPGQVAVFYDLENREVLGGGKILK